MEGWRLLYKGLISVVVLYALYNVFLLSKLRKNDEKFLLKKEEIVKNQLGQITDHLNTLEKNQNHFNNLVLDMEKYILEIKANPRKDS